MHFLNFLTVCWAETNVHGVFLSQKSKKCSRLKNQNWKTFQSYFFIQFNTSYLTDLYIVFTLKMESVFKNTIFGLKMMEKIILKSLHEFVILGTFMKYGGISRSIFSRPLFTIIFRPKIVFLDTDSILRVKTMYKSVK